MKATFVDTSFMLALLLKRDAHHEKALAWQRAMTGEIVTTEYVVTEFVDALSARPVRRQAVLSVRELRADKQTRVIPADTALLEEGLTFFMAHADKEWSLTDCVSFVVMRREGLSAALTTDHHFEQAGFPALLRSEPPRPA